MRINIGCGQAPTSGWKNFDNSLSLKLAQFPFLPELLLKLKLIEQGNYEFILFARLNQIEYGDVTKGLPLADNSAEVIYSSHVLEHLDQAEATLFLNESKRLLMPGGILRLAIPDVKRKVDHYLLSGDADQFILSMYMCAPRPRTIAQRLKILMVGARQHHWMYDGESLCRLLMANGFEEPRVVPTGITNIKNPGELNLSERLAESMYVEAKKSLSRSKNTR